MIEHVGGPPPASSPFVGPTHMRVLACIVLLSVLLRVAAAVALGDVVEPKPGTYDQVSYDALAMRLVEGHGFSFAEASWPYTRPDKPTAFWSYLYTFFLAAIYGLVGHHPIVPRLVQSVAAGVCLPMLLYALTRRLFGSRPGVWAAMIGAVYAYFIYYAATLMTEAFTILAVLALLLQVVKLSGVPTAAPVTGSFAAPESRSSTVPNRETSWRMWAVLGLLVAVAAYLRQVTLILVPGLALWLLAIRPSLATLRGLALSGLVAAALFGPVVWRNYRVFGEFVLLNTNAGFAFFWSNHPVQGTDFQAVLSEDRGNYHDLVPAGLRDLSEAALDKALLRRGLQFVVSDPVRYLRLSASRLKTYFLFWPSPESSLISNLSRILSFGLCLPFMVYGLWLSRRAWRQALPLFLTIATYSLVHLFSWALIRYRLPVDAILLVFASLACDQIWQRATWRRPATIQRIGAL